MSFLQCSISKAKDHHCFTGTTIPLPCFNYSTTDHNWSPSVDRSLLFQSKSFYSISRSSGTEGV